MRKLAFTFLLLSLTFGLQAETLLGNFEDGGISPAYSDDGSMFTSLSIVANPEANSLNPTGKVLSGTTRSADWWAGLKLNFNGQSVEVGDASRYLHILIKTGLQEFEPVVFASSGEKWAGKYAVTTSGWFDYVLDLYNLKGGGNTTSLQGTAFTDIRITCYSDNAANQGKTLILDEIVLNDNPDSRTDAVTGGNVSAIDIDCNTVYQTIEGFAASDCWMGNFIGQWNGNNKGVVAKYLFSQNLDSSGNPEGIGLSMWRVNLGAGSYEQGDVAGNIGKDDPNYIMRRAESYLQNDIITSNNTSIDINANSNYDWSKCAGQQYFMQQAKSYGCESFVAFSNSPLVIYTKNGKAYSASNSAANIGSGNYDKYADYLANVVKHFKDAGYNFKYISPVNEPQWDWNAARQEGSPWTNSEIKSMVTALNTSITSKGLTDTKIMITEAGQWDYVYGQSSDAAGNQIEAFFNSANSNYVGNLANVAPMIAGHSYWKDKKNSDIRSVRQSVKSKAATYNLQVFQTEWSMMEDNGIDGLPSNYNYMDVAMNMAKIIHSDMAYANAASWSYWTAMDLERWSQKNRFILVRVRPSNSDYPTTYTQLKTQGPVAAQPNMWALGNYSFFVRPGYKRIDLTGASDLAGLMGTAYISPANAAQQKVVAVFVNIGTSDKAIMPAITGLSDLAPTSYTVYETSASHTLDKTLSGNYDDMTSITVAGRSVVTIVFDLEDPANSNTPIINTLGEKTSSLQIYPNPAPVGGKITVCLPGKVAERLILSFYSAQGNKVYSLEIDTTNGIENINLPANLPKGLYLQQAISGNQIYNNKLMIY